MNYFSAFMLSTKVLQKYIIHSRWSITYYTVYDLSRWKCEEAGDVTTVNSSGLTLNVCCHYSCSFSVCLQRWNVVTMTMLVDNLFRRHTKVQVCIITQLGMLRACLIHPFMFRYKHNMCWVGNMWLSEMIETIRTSANSHFKRVQTQNIL